MQYIKTGIIGLMLLSMASLAFGQGVILSTGGVPNIADANGSKGFLPDNTDSTPNPSFFKCAGGTMGPSAGRGYNCLMQVDQDDTTGYMLGLFYKSGTNDPFPIFRVDRSGATIMDYAQVQPNIAEGAIYWNPYFFGDPTNRFQENCAFCATGNSSQDVNKTHVILGAYGTPVNLYAPYPLFRAFGQTRTNLASGLQYGTMVYELGDEGHSHIGGAYGSGSLDVSACGTGSPTIAGADGAFVITLGTGNPSECTVSFHATWTSTDITCTFISETDGVNWKFAKIGSANAWTGVTFTSSAALTNASKIHGLCVGHL